MKSWLTDFLLLLFLMTAALSGLLHAQTTTSRALAGVAANPETHPWMIELVKQLLANLWRQQVENVTGSLGECRAYP